MAGRSARSLHVFVSAGVAISATAALDFLRCPVLRHYFCCNQEPSGDMLAAATMRAIREQSPERMGLPEEVTFSGIGGELMKKEGLDPIFDMSELSVSDPLCRRMHCALPGADKADRPTSAGRTSLIVLHIRGSDTAVLGPGEARHLAHSRQQGLQQPPPPRAEAARCYEGHDLRAPGWALGVGV
eukprot:2515102-Rhodomonas_salina.1